MSKGWLPMLVTRKSFVTIFVVAFPVVPQSMLPKSNDEVPVVKAFDVIETTPSVPVADSEIGAGSGAQRAALVFCVTVSVLETAAPLVGVNVTATGAFAPASTDGDAGFTVNDGSVDASTTLALV
jgi:hypothetical protein